MKYACDHCGATFPTSVDCITHEVVCSGKVKRVDVTHHVLTYSFDGCGLLHTEMTVTEDYGYYHKDGKYYYDVEGRRKLDCVGEPTTCVDDRDNVYFCFTRTEFSTLSDEDIESILYSMFTEHIKDIRENIDKYLNKEEKNGDNRN